MAEETIEMLYEEPMELMDNDQMTLLAVIGDTMYLHQAMKQTIREQFLEAMIKEIDTHQKRGNTY